MFPAFRSFPEKELIEQCERACRESGTGKVMFLADSSGEYGLDTDSSLPQLIRKLKERIGPELKVGISQLNPEHFLRYRGEMTEFIKSGNIVYLNVPIQSASDRILKSMRRNYGRADIERLFGAFEAIGFRGFSTHLLFGFPGEEEENIDDSLEFILEHRPRHVVASAFMPHPAIDASAFPGQVPPEVTERRLKKCEAAFTEQGIKVATDWGALTNRIMNRIRHSLNLELKEYGPQE